MAYGIYLIHGGDPDVFGKLSQEDVDIMLNTYYGLQDTHDEVLAKRIVKTLYGGDQRWLAWIRL